MELITAEDIKNLTEFLKTNDSIHRTRLASNFKLHDDPEKSSIDSYINFGYERINSYLRLGPNKPLEDNTIESHIRILNLALEKCPPVPCIFLYRAESSMQPNWYVKKWFNERIGKVIKFPAFTSCSQERRRVEFTSILFKILTHQNTKAFNINDNGGKQCEMECLFQNNTTFKIISATGDKSKIEVELEEVKSQEGITIYEHRYYHLPNMNFMNKQPLTLND